MPQDGFIQTSGTRFTLNGGPFYFAGANNYYLSYKSEFMVNAVLDAALAMGLKALRTWAFLDRGSLDGTVPDTDPPGAKEGVYFQYWDPMAGTPAYHDAADGLQRLDFVIHAAGLRGLKLILPLVNNWREFGGMDQYAAWFGLRSHDEFYIDSGARDAYRNWALHLLNRRNGFSGVLYKDEPAILAWELANEPRCEDSEALFGWVEQMSAFLKENDASHLIGVGDEGQSGNDFLQIPGIDFGTVHLYPEILGKDLDWGARQIEKQIRAGQQAGKPVIVEEYGWKDRGTREEAYRAWLETIERAGGAADLFWMLSGPQDDGTPYPDYDHYTIYGSADSPAIVTHAAAMTARNFENV